MNIIIPGFLMLAVMAAALGVGLLLGILIDKYCNPKIVEKEDTYRIVLGDIGSVYIYYQGKIIARENSMEDALKTVELHKQIVK